MVSVLLNSSAWILTVKQRLLSFNLFSRLHVDCIFNSESTQHFSCDICEPKLPTEFLLLLPNLRAISDSALHRKTLPVAIVHERWCDIQQCHLTILAIYNQSLKEPPMTKYTSVAQLWACVHYMAKGCSKSDLSALNHMFESCHRRFPPQSMIDSRQRWPESIFD